MKPYLYILVFVGFSAVGNAHYNPAIGRFLNRDPIREEGGVNLYGMAGNNPVNSWDVNGLWEGPVHRTIVDHWLDKETYEEYEWRCLKLKVIEKLKDGSNQVDGDGISNWGGFLAAQATANSFQHAMRGAGQSEWAAEALYSAFVSSHIRNAKMLASQARATKSEDPKGKELMEKAILELGMAFHSVSDSLSPAHHGFQDWFGPERDTRKFFQNGDYFNPSNPVAYVQVHKAKETMAVYQSMRGGIIAYIKSYFGGDLGEILKE